jgi:hypothetical protein
MISSALLAGCCRQQAKPCCTQPPSLMPPSGSASCSKPSASAHSTQRLLPWCCRSGLAHARPLRRQLHSVLRRTALIRRCWRRGGRLRSGWRHQIQEVGRELHAGTACCTCAHEMGASLQYPLSQSRCVACCCPADAVQQQLLALQPSLKPPVRQQRSQASGATALPHARPTDPSPRCQLGAFASWPAHAPQAGSSSAVCCLYLVLLCMH